jgi:glycosyltransferase involved in cell wall biosynthesis
LQKRLRHLLLATLEDPYDPRSWSGTPYHIRLALQAKIERVSIIAKLKPRRTVSNAVLRVILGGTPPRYPLYLTPAAQRQFAAQTLHAIHEYRPDAVLAISSHNLVAMGVPPVPTFMVTDAPWLAWKETYQDYETLPLLGRRFARLEAQAAQRCTGLIFSSEWACAEAVRLYGVPRHKLHSIPLGASWTPDVATERLMEIIAARPDDKLDLLFVGKDWERKGGPLAIEIARHLKLRGVSKVRLHIVGCRPPLPADAAEFIECHGFLNAKKPHCSKNCSMSRISSWYRRAPNVSDSSLLRLKRLVCHRSPGPCRLCPPSSPTARPASCSPMVRLRRIMSCAFCRSSVTANATGQWRVRPTLGSGRG